MNALRDRIIGWSIGIGAVGVVLGCWAVIVGGWIVIGLIVFYALRAIVS